MNNSAINNINAGGPRVTVIVAVYNGAKILPKCIESIDRQTYQNRELIIMDGGSTDGTVEILKNNTQKISFWDSSADRGIYHAFNKALVHATGDWIYFLGADDVLHDEYVFEKFSSIIRNIEKLPLVAYGKIIYCKGRTRKLMGDKWNKVKDKTKSAMYIPHQGMFHNKKLFEKCGNFDERFQISGDYHLLLRSLRYGEPFFMSDIVVADQYAGGKSGDRGSRWRVLQEFRDAQRDLGLGLTSRWMWEYIKAFIWRGVYAVISHKQVFR